MTETEAIHSNKTNLFLFDTLNKEGKLSLEEFGELIPGLFHINRKEDIALEFMNNRGCELFDKSVQDIANGGVELIMNITHPKTTEIVQPNLIKFYQENDDGSIISYFQKLKFEKDNDYNLYISTSKIYEKAGGLVTVTIPVSSFVDVAHKIEKVFDENLFMKQNFKRFAQFLRFTPPKFQKKDRNFFKVN